MATRSHTDLSYIGENVQLGEGCQIGAFCELGIGSEEPLIIGDGAIIRSHSTIYGGSEYGPGLETGHYTLLRSGNSVGTNLRIGSYSSLEGAGKVGDYVRIHGRCEMTSGIIHNFARVYGGTYITDNRRPPMGENAPCMLGEGCIITMGCIIVAGVRIGMGAYVAAGMVVSEDVPDRHLLRRDGTLRRLKTFWPEHYRADYPPEAQERLSALSEYLLDGE